ncbi:Fe-S cluster assembly protein SufB [Candidatus Gottesmanbacteria bacterium RIFCSPHIGHO2_01_FULL_39_10]|uniref:Fe-S cluster assembly protein SufB n=1 Tax=Candidatus Gottesmanbacteria bacterium RIFCSPHIGHO2_01_FULL_39_10 TaxID=1798375 RepID=A0A1F5ZKR9_9BACT|nr:MAG: Fe-S cluster assembly protein SufB [Candidatus Gottesmanbacteria bacterium RIFCSPHIGHO2_01_FULL_39_10]
MQQPQTNLDFEYKYGFSMPQKYIFKSKKGLDDDVVRNISRMKQEPVWMTDFRLKAYHIFKQKVMPTWGADLSDINFDDIYYYIKPTDKQVNSWEELPKEIKETYDRIGVPEAEKKFLSGVSAQYESEVVYESVNRELKKIGVIFSDMDTGLRKYPEIIKKYFGTLIPPHDNKFAALNSAVWSGGSFVYVPKGVKVAMPLQAYFRINAERFGQFERTLIIAEEGSYVHYIEGCTAPVYTTNSLHSAVVEIFVHKNARVRYTTVQNWSNNVYNLVTKRARAEKQAVMEWVDCNIGSKVTMKYPSVYLMGEGARGEVLSIAFAGGGQHQDAGAKMLHFAPNTSSRIISKSISKAGGRTSYRGLVQIMPKAKKSSVFVSCDALILDEQSRSDTYPYMKIKENDVTVQHEATVEKIGEEKLFYLTSKGISRSDAEGLLVNGFIEPVVKEIPLEYSIELNRLINLEMSGSVG